MLSAALSRVTTPEPLAVQADAPDRLRWLIKESVKTVEVGIGYGGLAALLTDEDPAFTKLFRRILAKQRAELESVIDAGKADGSFRGDVDAATLVDAVVGAHIAERTRTGRIARDGKADCSTFFGRPSRGSEQAFAANQARSLEGSMTATPAVRIGRRNLSDPAAMMTFMTSTACLGVLAVRS